MCFLFVGDFLPPPPPPLDDAGALPSGSGNFPPPPPLDEGAFRAQVRSVVGVMFISHAGKLMNSVIVSVADKHLSRACRELYNSQALRRLMQSAQLRLLRVLPACTSKPGKSFYLLVLFQN